VKLEILLIAVGIAAASISFMVMKPADILQPFRDAVHKIEVIRDKNADVGTQLGTDIHDVRPGGATENAANSKSNADNATSVNSATGEPTPFPESSVTSLSPPVSAAAATEAAAAAANANAATVKAFSELH
jgi:hypothetical protein